MGGPTSTPDGYEGTNPKKRVQYINKITTGTLLMRSPTDNKEANKRPSRYVNHHGIIRTYGRILR